MSLQTSSGLEPPPPSLSYKFWCMKIKEGWLKREVWKEFLFHTRIQGTVSIWLTFSSPFWAISLQTYSEPPTPPNEIFLCMRIKEGWLKREVWKEFLFHSRIQWSVRPPTPFYPVLLPMLFHAHRDQNIYRKPDIKLKWHDGFLIPNYTIAALIKR